MMNSKIIGIGLLVAAMALPGCAKNDDTANTDSAPPAKKEAEAGSQADHAHHGSGPNGGVIFDLGRHHAEFTVDHEGKTCQILVLGDDQQTPVAIAATELTLTTKETKTADGTVVAPMTITLQPQDAKDGNATVFVGTDPGIGNVADFEGTVLGLIDGKPSQGEFSESDSEDGHSHSH